MSTLLKAAGVADVLVIESQARDNGFGFQVTSVPKTFDMPETEFFDPAYMKALFDTGYERALEGEPWREIVPAGAGSGPGIACPAGCRCVRVSFSWCACGHALNGVQVICMAGLRSASASRTTLVRLHDGVLGLQRPKIRAKREIKRCDGCLRIRRSSANS